MKTNTLRKKYLEYFSQKNHKIFSSDSLVPLDATVLFTSAGMNQFKPYFLGEKKDVKRAASCQKCLRTGDLERVGKTAYHHTFFEMLGNFSFGDYFKKEAIEFAWEFLTVTLNMKAHDLWVSVYEEDDEAHQIWKEHIGIENARIVSLGPKENFWPANAPIDGPNGPCGPCSEIFFDRGESSGCKKKTCSPACSCGRFVEVWNLVFTQFNRIGENDLKPLPQKNIDTGMGLERMASVLQQKGSNFDIDILLPVVTYVEGLLHSKNKGDGARSLINAIVDHARAATFAVSDGVFPSNEEMGYVIRKLIRKAFWHGFSLGKKEPFVYKLVEIFSQYMGTAYPELPKNQEKISQTIRLEEERFLKTVKGARSQFNVVASEIARKRLKVIDGQAAFKLYDTHGLPLELTKELALEHGLSVDETGFYQHLAQQRNDSRKKSMFKDAIFTKEDYGFNDATRFCGYDTTVLDAAIIRIIKENQDAKSLASNDAAVLVLDATPFYPEGGGQLADNGYIETSEGIFRVEDVQKTKDALLHFGKVSQGVISKGNCRARVSLERRAALARAHTATHLLQSALRTILGNHVTQQGSLVDTDRLRFDFTHPKALTQKELQLIEERVNELILKGLAVQKKTTSLDNAKQEGALAFFKEKYTHHVRVVSIMDVSKELCGGIHLENSLEAGSFCIVSESSIASGVRRIEALTGKLALMKLFEYRKVLKNASHALKVPESELDHALRHLTQEVKNLSQTIERLQKENLAQNAGNLKKAMIRVGCAELIAFEFKDVGNQGLLYLADLLRKQVNNLVVFFVSTSKRGRIFVCAITKELQQKGLSVGKVVSSLQEECGIKGGGKGLVAQGRMEKNVAIDILKKRVTDIIRGVLQ